MKGEIISLGVDPRTGTTEYAVQYIHSRYPIPKDIAWKYNLIPGTKIDFTLSNIEDASGTIEVSALGLVRNGIGMRQS